MIPSARDVDATMAVEVVEHNVVNTSPDEPLRLYTLYSRPDDPDGTVQRTKQDTEAAHARAH